MLFGNIIVDFDVRRFALPPFGVCDSPVLFDTAGANFRAWLESERAECFPELTVDELLDQATRAGVRQLARVCS